MNDPSVAEEYAEFSNRALTLLSFRRVISAAALRGVVEE